MSIKQSDLIKVNVLHGTDYLNNQVLEISRITKANYSFVAKYDEEEDVVNTVSLCSGSSLIENINYSPIGTPCGKVLEHSACVYENNVQKLFPKDQLLIDMGINSYVGFPLYSIEKNKLIGIVVSLFKNEIKNRTAVVELFKSSLSRIELEMDRLSLYKDSIKAKKRYQEFSNLSIEAIMVHQEGVLLDVNARSSLMLGYSYDEFIGLDGLKVLVHPEDLPVVAKNIKEKKEESYVIRFIKKNGSVIYAEVRSKNIMYKNKDARVSMIRDVTEELLIKKELEDASYYLDSMSDALLVVDMDLAIIEINKASCGLWGFSSKELYEKQVLELFPAYEHKKHLESMGRAINTGAVCQFETTALTKEGEEIAVELNGKVIRDADATPVGLTAVVRDITLRKEAELKLKENENKYKILFENLEEGFAQHRIVLNEKGKPIDYVFLDVNSPFEELTGLKMKNIIGKKVTEVIPEIKNDSFDWVAAYGKVALGGDSYRFEQYSTVLDKWYSVYVYSPSHLEFVTLFYDITKSKEDKQNLEELVEISTKELTKTIDKLNNEIIEKIVVEKKLTNSVKEKEVLLNEIHHRVKNNLQIVWGLLDLQQRRSTKKEIVDALDDSKNRINSIALIHESLYKNENFSMIKLKDYISQLVKNVEQMNSDGNQMVSLVQQIDEISLSLDKSVPLGLIINEIISNCYKHAFLGRTRGEVNIVLKKEKNKTVLIIGDDGVGFDFEEKLKTSNGIGIKLISNLCKQIDAEMKVNSVPQKETKYQISINEQ